MSIADKKSKAWYLYILQCGNGNLYTGITTDVKRRFREHQENGKTCAKCLRGKGPLTLVLKKRIGIKNRALRIEFKIKKLSKVNKLDFIRGKFKIRELE